MILKKEMPVGPHFLSNPYALTYDCLEKRGKHIVKDAPRTFEGSREIAFCSRKSAFRGLILV